MRIFKRLSTLLLAAALAVSLAACSPDNGGKPSGNTGTGTNTGTSTTINGSGTSTTINGSGTGTGSNTGSNTGTNTGTGSGTTTNPSTTATPTVTTKPTATTQPTTTTQPAATTKPSNDGIIWKYSVNDDGKTATLTSYSSEGLVPSGTVQLPSSVDGYTITKIDTGFSLSSGIFKGTTNVTGVIIPNTITEIGDYAFIGSKITELHIPSSVKKLGESITGECLMESDACTLKKVTIDGNPEMVYSFSTNSALETVVINGMTDLSDHAFFGCDKLSSVTLPEGLKTIGDSAFWGCSSLKQIKFPSTLTEIGDKAFLNCALESVSLPDGILKIGDSAFSESLGSYASGLTYPLKELYVPSSVTAIATNAIDHNWHNTVNVYYGGGKADWEKIKTGGGDGSDLDSDNVIIYYYATGLGTGNSQDRFKISVEKSGNKSGGTVTGGGRYDVGELVTVKATANAGYGFKEWQKDGVTIATTDSYSFTAKEDCTLTAIFLKKYTVKTAVENGEGGTVSDGGDYISGASVTVTASAKSGYAFKGWQKDGVTVSTDPSYSFTATEDCTLTAVFEEDYAKNLKPYTYTSVSYNGNDYSDYYVLKNFSEKACYNMNNYSALKTSGCTAVADAAAYTAQTGIVVNPLNDWKSGVGCKWIWCSVSQPTWTVSQQLSQIYTNIINGKATIVRFDNDVSIGHSVAVVGIRKGVDKNNLTESDLLLIDPSRGKVMNGSEVTANNVAAKMYNRPDGKDYPLRVTP